MELQEDSELTTGVDETDSDGGSDEYEDSQATGHHSEQALNTVHDAGTYNSPCGYCHSGAPSSCAHGAWMPHPGPASRGMLTATAVPWDAAARLMTDSCNPSQACLWRECQLKRTKVSHQ